MLKNPRRNLYLLSLLSALLLLVPMAMAQDGMDITPPRVIDTNPLPGEELALDSAVRFVFDRPMDTESIITMVSVSPELNGVGELTWEDNGTVLVYTPPSNYERDTEYTFTVDAEDADGLPMADPFVFKIQTIGYLEIGDIIPRNGTQNISADSAITVIFNRPVVPLVVLEEQGDLPSPITISPEVDGDGEWLNTSIYIFHPTPGFKGGLEYTVTVDAGLEAVDGAVLAEPYSFSFTTSPPEMEYIRIDPNSSIVTLDPTITVAFTQPMDTSTEAGVRLENNLGTSIPLTYSWDETRRMVTIEPTELLELESFYEIVVDSSILQSESGAQLASSTTRSFQTVPYPAIVRTEPNNGDGDATPYGGFRIYFNAPIDPDSIEGKVTVEPAPFREFETYYYDYDNRYSLLFDTEPSTTYTITIDPGISDPYGNVIQNGLTVTYTTGAYDPDLTLQVPGGVGVYNAYSPSTRLFATHRNISQIDSELYSITLQELANATGNDSYRFYQDYSPRRGTLLRQWTTPVEGQLNEWRYELLIISAVGSSGVDNLTCVGAPETRLRSGITAIVSDDDPTPLRMRSEPNLSGQILEEYDPGAELNIISGPICSDRFWWWNVYDPISNREGWMAEGNASIYFMEPVGDVAPLESEELPVLEPGAYYLRTHSPETAALGYNVNQHILVVATHNITMKFNPTQALAWVNHMESGVPVEGMSVRFYDQLFNEVATATTDADGLASVNIPRLEDLYTTIYAVIDNGTDFGFVATDFSRGIDPWRFNLNTDYAPDMDSGYIYTDRPIYRPDQPVYFRGIIRARDDVTYSVMNDLQTVLVNAYDAENQIIYEDILELSPYGTFNGQFDLDQGASLGYYRIAVLLPDGEAWRDETGVGFSVAEYRAPEFQVTATPAVDAVVQGDNVRVEVDSRYFFGAPVSNARIVWNVVGENYFFNYDGPGRWSFIDFNYDEGPGEFYGPAGEQIANGESTTDELGKFFIEVPTDLGEKTQSQAYTVEAVVIDESDQAVAGRTQVIVHQGAFYIGLAPETYVSQAEKETSFRVLSVDWDGQPIADQPVDYRIVRREWNSVQEKDPQGRTVWKWNLEEIEIDNGSVITDADGRADVLFTPPLGGAYKMYANGRDADGNLINSSAFMWVSGSNYIPWRQQNSNTIDLISDSDSYSVGDEAEILIASPFQGDTYALISVERGGFLKTEVVKMDTNSYVYRLPIEENYAPNVYVSVMLVKGLDDTSPYTQFRFGMIQLGVDTERLDLNVDVTADLGDAEFAGPGDEVTLQVKTTDWQGEPVSAEVGVGVTDLAVLSIAPPNSQSLMSFFYGQRGLSVRTASPLTISADQVTQEIIDTIKGGGGGGSELGIFEVRQEFVDTPLWAPSVVTDANGEGEVTITLPDNLTTWRIDARGLTMGDGNPMLVGQSLTDFISTKPLLVRPVTPRFMVVGDKLTIGTIVNNNTSDAQEVDVLMEGTGFLVSDDTPLRQHVTIPAGGRARVDWQIEVLDVSFVDITFAAINDDQSLQDASKPPVGLGDDRLLPVYRYSVKETVGTAGLIESDEAASITEVVGLPPRIIDNSQGDLRIEIDRSLAGPVLDGLTYLRNYEHQCIEQTVSRFLPNVMTIRALVALDQSNPELEAELQVQVNFGLQRLYSQQRVDGGWGWFPQDPSNPLTTSYALIGLVEAQASGFNVDERVISSARTFLRTWLLQNPSVTRNPEQFWMLNRRVFVLYAMARAGEPNASMLTVAYDNRVNLNLDAKAFLSMALTVLDSSDARIDALMSDFANQATLSATGVHWDDRPDYYNWTTNTRTTALILMAMMQHDQSNALLSGAVRWLMVARTADAWETTQETAWAVMSLTDWMVRTKELEAEYVFNARLNGEVLSFEDNTATSENVKESEVLTVAVADLLLDEANRLVISKTEGPGNLYYTAHLNAYLNVPDVEALSQGIIVNRKYYLKDDPDKKAITSAEVGQQVIAEITIIAPRNLHYVLIEDPIPAGSEAVDTNLLTTSQIGERPSLERDDPLSRGWGWWWFSRTEFRDEKVVMYSTYLPRGTYTYRYELRMGLAGEYNVIPTTGQEFYFPEVYGRGDGMLFTISPATEQVATTEE